MVRVRMITPDAMKISSLRMGNSSPYSIQYGMVNISESVMVPFGPPTVMTAALRQRSAVIGRRLPVSWSLTRRSMTATHMKRMPTTTAVTSRIRPSRVQLLTSGSAQLFVMAPGSCMPSRMNTAPLRLKAITDHTDDETMLVRATFGPTPVRSKRMIRPAATTVRMPDTWIISADRYSRNGRKISIRMRDVVVSHPSRRMVSNSQLTATPISMPNSVPPVKDTTKSPNASPSLNVPVVAATMANWKPTMPVASLNSDSPFSTEVWRMLSEASRPSELTATASVGPRAAPSAKAADSGTIGHAEPRTNPTATIVAVASPMASDRDSLMLRSSADLSML